MTPITAGLLVTLVLAFVIAGTETALLSLDPTERQRMSSEPIGRMLVERLGPRLEITVLIAGISNSVALAALTTSLVATWVPTHSWLVVAAITPVIVLAPDMAARALAWRFRLGWARAAVWWVLAIHALLSPLGNLVLGLVGFLARPFRTPDTEHGGSEIRSLIEQGAEAGSVAERERAIVEAVFEFGEMTVGRLMTSRTDMFAVAIDTPWSELLERCREHGYSRVPIFHRRTDEIIGVLLLKDLLRYSAAGGLGPHQLRALLLPPTWVPQSKPANAMLRDFLSKKQHMAFVVDELGTLVGLITLDDLLTELVGEFLDQDEPDDQSIVSQPGQHLVKAWMDIDDFAEETGIEIPQDGYHTVGGFVFHRLGRLPHKGDIVQHDGHKFLVHSMDGRRIGEILVQSSELGAVQRDEVAR